ncbi:MAG: BspA family leucine-rich repeat surface protein [Lachnospiraceae bacterium]|nr:BspA family leucine-rich repeat surface protein [Lachnospiraceae bacterium]
MKKNFYRMVAFLTAALMVLSNNEIMAFASENAPEETTVIEETVIDEPEETTEDIIVEETSEETSEEVIAEDETSEEQATEENAEELSEDETEETSTEENAEEISEEVVEEPTEEVEEDATEEVAEEIEEETEEEISEEEIEEIEDTVAEEDFEAAKSDIDSGTSNNISWRITSEGKLIVTGTGDWKKCKGGPLNKEVYAPWKAYDTKIKSAQITLTGTTDTSYMFDNCIMMTKVDLKGLDTSNVTNMSYMFQDCWNVNPLDVSNFNTSKVTDFTGMFEGCNDVTSLNLSNFDTSNAVNMSKMFFGCHSMTNIDLSSFNTSKVTDMSKMFEVCSAMVSLDLSMFDTSNVTSFADMFYDCKKLVLPDLSGFTTSKVTDMSGMFALCTDLVYLDLSNFDTSNVTNMSSMFSLCKNLSTLDISSFDTKSLANANKAYGMFNDSNKVSKIVTPKNFTLSEFKLPGTAEWKDENGAIYDYFPATSKLLVTTTYGEDEYFIMYELDGGKNNADNKMKYPANKSFTLKNPTKTGYTFAGWVDIKTAEKVTVAKGKNYVVRATWTPNSYDVVFNGNGGVFSGADSGSSKKYTQTLIYGTSANLRPVAFTRTGYTFKGWTTKADGKGTFYADYASVKNLTATANGKVNLYAKWEANSYTVSFDINTGLLDKIDDRSGEMKDVSAKYGKAVKIPKNKFHFVGHTFKGWSLTPDGTVKYKNGASVKNLTDVANGNVKLYAVWSVNTYNVKFDLCGVKTTTKPSTVKGLSYKTNPLTLEKVIPADSDSPYVFVGWSTSKVFLKAEIIYVSSATANLDATKNNQTFTLYAVWAYSFQYAGADGTLKGAGGLKDWSIPFNMWGDGKDGYYIAGWNTNSAAALKGKIKYKANAKYKNFIGKIIYPVYKANKYTIKFNANGGKGKMSNQTLTYDKDATLKACAFKNGTKKFVGWSTDKDETAVTYIDKQAVKNLTKKNKDTITLYAVWQ